MKKINILLLLVLITFQCFSQQVNKNLVVVEIKTGTWCQYCPGAALGADDLANNFNDAVAIIENHGGDDYQNDASSSRINYYPSSGYPTAYFNGLNSIVGGDHTQSMYSYYLPKYNSAISELTSFNITSEVNPVSDNSFNVTVTVDKTDSYSGTNLVAHLVLTESDIQETWQGQDELNFVNRAMFPSPSGTNLDFSGGNQQIINYNVNLDNSWVSENCELIAFIQDNSTYEILQGTKTSLNIPIGTNNAMLKSIDYPNGENTICEDAISPIITIKNRGSENLTSLTINYEINNEGVLTYYWTGNIPFGETQNIVLNEIAYSPVDINQLDISVSSPNSFPDDDLTNNSLSINFNKSVESTTLTYLEIYPNGSFGLPWELRDASNNVLYNGNASGTDIINETFELGLNQCYNFNLTSSMGNGIPEGGYFSLKDSRNNQVYYGNGDSFSSDITVPFKVTSVSSVEKNELINVFVYPNPANDKIFIKNLNPQINLIIISDLTGKIIFTKKLSNHNSKITINTDNYKSGIYFVSISNDTETVIKKITILK